MFHLRTLGGLALERDGVAVDAVGAQRKTLALLALLAASRDAGIGRERLAAFLWPESDAERARGALKQTLHVARRQLGTPAAISGTSELRLNPTWIDSDVDAFLTALEHGELEHAVGLYRGSFLDGFHLPGAPAFEEWSVAQRDELRHRYASALERLASAAERGSDTGAAVEWLRRLQATDPFSTRTTLRLMHALDAAGERIAALRCAQVHEALLREEMDSPPDPDVAAFAERLRVGGGSPRSPAAHAGARADPGSDPSSPTATAPVAAADEPVRLPAATRRGASRRRHAALAAASLVVTTVAALWFLTNSRESPNASAAGVVGDSVVAVLPFVNVSGDGGVDHLAAGLADEVSSALSATEGIRVVPHGVAAVLQRSGFEYAAIADSLGVSVVVEGSVEQAGDRMRVSARMVRVHDGAILWYELYDRAPDAVMQVRGEIVRGIAGVLYPRSAASARTMNQRTTNDSEAYDLYLRGRHAWRQRSREGIRQAVVFMEGAIERDPGFAMAYAGLAATYVNCANFGYCDPREALARAGVAADRALTLDDGLAEAHAAKGFVLASGLELQAAEAELRQAIELSGNLTWAHHYYTLLLLMLGRTDEARQQNMQALAIDPLSLPANATRGIILLQQGDLTGAERELQRALALSPGFQLTLYYLGVVKAARGDYEDAGQLLERAALESPSFTGVPGARAYVLQRTGRRAAADGLLADVAAHASRGDERARMNLALAYAALGRLDEAFDAFALLPWDVPSLVDLRADPLLQPLRTDPRYIELLRRIGAGR